MLAASSQASFRACTSSSRDRSLHLLQQHSQRSRKQSAPSASPGNVAHVLEGPLQPRWRMMAAAAAASLFLLATGGPMAQSAAAAGRPTINPASSTPLAPRTTAPGTNVGFASNEEVDQRRRDASFVRSYDGHVALLNRQTGELMDAKCDLQVPGALLLRDPDGQVYYIGYARLKQVDLSDDAVVSAIAADGWEKHLRPIQAPDEGGEVQRLILSREVFYELVSVLGEPGEAPGSGR